jgi:hypothetical protein
MIDKLAIGSPDMDFEALKNAFGQTVTSKPLCKNYHTCRSVRTLAGDHLFTAYWNPKTPSADEFRLELNPAKLGLTHSRMLRILDYGLDIDSAKIQRIDHAADFNLPVAKAFEGIRIKHKRKVRGYDIPCEREWINGELTGYSIGSRFEKFAIYNKSYEEALKNKDFSSPLEDRTRFELRQTTKKIQFRLLKDLPFLMGFNPFASMEMLELKPGAELTDEFLKLRKMNGLQNTYIQLNKHGNARRNTKKCFDLTDLPDKLTNIYRYNLGQFFSEDAKVAPLCTEKLSKEDAISEELT